MAQGFTNEQVSQIQRNAVASDAGPVVASEYLPFLKAFRTIVESEVPPDQQVRQMQALRQTWPRFYDTLGKDHGGLATRWFVDRLCELPGIGKKSAKALYDAGHLTSELVLNLSDDELLKVPGIGKGTITKLRHQPKM